MIDEALTCSPEGGTHSIMKNLQLLALLVGLASAGFIGCKKDEAKAPAIPPPAATPAASPAGKAPVAVPPAAARTAPARTAPATPGKAPAGDSGMSGTILETMDSGGYTYAQLNTGSSKIWAAAPTVKLTVGQVVTVVGGMLMKGFHSKTLNRTFPEIYFAAGFKGAAPAAPAAPAASHAGKPAPSVASVGTIAPAAGGKRIAELYAAKDALKGKSVTVRGKVVKFNAEIMGHNWIHLQDGSGAAGTNDLTVTTKATAKVGDVVTVSGKVALDRDFGGGYKYPLIVEDATVAAK